MQFQAFECEVVLSFYCQRDFFNRADFRIRAGTRDPHCRRIVQACFDEIIFAKPDAFALFARFAGNDRIGDLLSMQA